MSGSGVERSGDGSDAAGSGTCEVAARAQRRNVATPARTRRRIGLNIQSGASRAGRVIACVGVAAVARTAAKPVNSTHAEAAGERGDEGSEHCERDEHDDEQREAGKECRGCRLQDRVDNSDECVKKNHLAIGRRNAGRERFRSVLSCEFVSGEWVEAADKSEAERAEEVLSGCERFSGGVRGVDEFGGVCREEAKGEAELGTVGAGGEVGDAECAGGRAEDGARRGHAVEHRKDLELGLELVGDEVDGEVGFAHCVLDSGGEMQCASGCFGSECLLSATQARGHHVFERDIEA